VYIRLLPHLAPKLKTYWPVEVDDSWNNTATFSHRGITTTPHESKAYLDKERGGGKKEERAREKDEIKHTPCVRVADEQETEH
jgi:hypothetical protein